MPNVPRSIHERLQSELMLMSTGCSRVAGVDEVGRGALAGPLVAAAVVLPSVDQVMADVSFWQEIVDSKLIPAAKRAALASEIGLRAETWAVARVDAPTIDEVGMSVANRMAMELAIFALPGSAPDGLLIDAMTLDLGMPQVGLIDGEAHSLAIAAASIVAKVARDDEMVAADLDHPAFGFARHKGYGVASHLAALNLHGPCSLHRRSFTPVRQCLERALEHV